MELELGLALPNQNHPMVLDLNCGYNNNNNNNNNNGLEIGKKNHGVFVDRDQHDVGDDEEEEVESKGLSLLLWSGQPNEEDDGERWRRLHVNPGENEEESDEIVGWPPINSLRKELLHRRQGGGPMAYRRQAANRIIPRSSMYVKVKMEGVPIGRKIDLRLFNSYQALTDTLIHMFAKYNGNDRQHEDYTILYQDREGDWMLAGDVPWETFVESVQRMEILRKNN
ncbi:auxin-responsive protein iaa29 [Phtheirospermum japonicum]|uniref:Auxin-responsive protein n=1 Tax=Phtheirospermum japonicum TaxID=374723 RepID=A0A830BEX1_9LAMI|nr:auxin-responsive protein iaa29 [Phtheirospermum japonicum]